ncbi:MAG: hypothetical protein ACW98X_18160 [Promethearchaeota archaeon]
MARSRSRRKASCGKRGVNKQRSHLRSKRRCNKKSGGRRSRRRSRSRSRPSYRSQSRRVSYSRPCGPGRSRSRRTNRCRYNENLDYSIPAVNDLIPCRPPLTRQRAVDGSRRCMAEDGRLEGTSYGQAYYNAWNPLTGRLVGGTEFDFSGLTENQIRALQMAASSNLRSRTLSPTVSRSPVSRVSMNAPGMSRARASMSPSMSPSLSRSRYASSSI